MNPAELAILQQHLDGAAAAIQRLHKKLRNLRNKGFATDADVEAATASRRLLQSIYARHGLAALDLDSRDERGKTQ